MTQVFVFIIEKINCITYYKLVMYNFRLVHNIQTQKYFIWI